MPHTFMYDSSCGPLILGGERKEFVIGDPNLRGVRLRTDEKYQKVMAGEGAILLDTAKLENGVLSPDYRVGQLHVLAPRDALVLLSVRPDSGGWVEYTSASYDEVEKKGRIERNYHPLPEIGMYDLAMLEELEKVRKEWPEKSEEDCLAICKEHAKVAGVTVLARGSKAVDGDHHQELLVQMMAGSGVRVRKGVKSRITSTFLLKWDRWRTDNQWEWSLRHVPLHK